MDVKIKRLTANAVIPSYAKDGDAGLDITATSVEYDESIDCYLYHTGIAIELPRGYVGLLFTRSSNRKTNCFLPNHVGVLDCGYRGEIIYSYKLRDSKQNIKDKDGKTDWQKFLPYKVGDRIGQLIIFPYPTINFIEVQNLSETERGESGFGSTGN